MVVDTAGSEGAQCVFLSRVYGGKKDVMARFVKDISIALGESVNQALKQSIDSVAKQYL
jgi:hypothetical protein